MSGTRRPSHRPRGTAAARVLTYLTVGVLAAAAIVNTPSIPTPAPIAAIANATRAPLFRHRADTIARGETMSAVLQRIGLGPELASHLLRSIESFDAKRVKPGMAIETSQPESDSLPTEVVFHLAADRLLKVARTDTGWVSREERLMWTTDTIVVDGDIRSTLYEALDRGATDLRRKDRAELAWALADIFEYRVDMSRDLDVGDRFRVLVQRQSLPSGATRIGPILAASFTANGSQLEAIRHVVDGHDRYYDQNGKSLQAAFLRAPVAFRRISSVFGMRFHPILGEWRAHRGTDYAAGMGTPVRAIGDGMVIFAGRKSGFGNVLEVRHPNGYVSRYGHLSRFVKTSRRGARVGIGQTIGFVGMTGLATAPHLHFEVLVNGEQQNPRVALRDRAGQPIAAGDRAAFDERRTALIAAMDRLQARRALAARSLSAE